MGISAISRLKHSVPLTAAAIGLVFLCVDVADLATDGLDPEIANPRLVEVSLPPPRRSLTRRARCFNAICLQALAARRWPPVPETALVVEAFYVLTAPAAATRCADFARPATPARPSPAWPRIARQMADPYALVAALKGLTRGASSLRKVRLTDTDTHATPTPTPSPPTSDRAT